MNTRFNDLHNMISNAKVIDDWPDRLSPQSHETPIITLHELKEAIFSDDFSELNQKLVIPQALDSYGRTISTGGLKPKPILFGDDEWSNRFCRASTHIPIRKASFTKIINKNMKTEAKVIAVSWLWFVTGRNSAKLSSTIRKIEQIISLYLELEKMGCKSFFDTNTPSVARTLINRISKDRNNRTARNILLTADSVNQVNALNLGRQYRSKTKFLKKQRRYEWDDSNQHYCIPFRIFMEYWHYYIVKLDTEFSLINFHDLEKVINLLFDFYEKTRGQNFNDKKRANELSLFCRNEAQATLRKLAESEWLAATGIVKLETSKRHAANKPFFRIYPQAIQNRLLYIGNLASHCVQTMTGMRDSERKEVRLGGLVQDDNVVGVVSTYHKFAPEGGTSDIYAAPKYVEKIFENMRKLYSYSLKIEDASDEIPLVGIHWLDYLRDKKVIPIANNHNQRRRKQLGEEANIIINHEDIHEFKLLNPNIKNPDKVDKEIQVGVPWPFKTHDSRRSIAVHLKRLDLVSTNDLLQQFKHFAYTQTEWYMSGFEYGGKLYKIAESFSREIDETCAELSASIAIKLQNATQLSGEGGKQLMNQSKNEHAPKIYPSFNVAKSMAKRNKQHLRSLGNGFYCMNGQDCEYVPIISSAACNIKCPSMVADKDSIPIWKSRHKAYKEQLIAALEAQEGDVKIEFLRLEVQFYEEALRTYGIFNHDQEH